VLVVPVLALGLRARAVRPALVLAAATGAVWFGVRLLVYPNLDGGIPDTWAAWRDASPGTARCGSCPRSSSRPAPARAVLAAPAGAQPDGRDHRDPARARRRRGRHLRAGPPDPAAATLAHVALVAVAGCLIVLKSLPVQSSLLLLPLIALAGLRWRDHLIWATTELAHFIGVWMFIAAASAPNRGLPAGFYMVLVVARLAGIGWLAVQAWRQAVDPDRDRVRTPLDGSPGEDDPLAGRPPLRDDEARLVAIG
jgi:hypothetical protein